MKRGSAFFFSLVLLIFSTSLPGQGEDKRLDLLIKGGRVVDGTGSGPTDADVGIRRNRIVFIGRADKAGMVPERTIDATGLIVAPGFIDPHTHTLDDLLDPAHHSNEPFLLQGVTTVITGNDGGGPINIAETLARMEQQGIGTNVGLLVGHGTIRHEVLGMSDAEPSADQLAQMKNLLREALDEGALGMSTGLYYAPGSYAKTEEVIELAKIVAGRGGIYDTHLRDESSYTIGLLESVQEAIRIGQEAKLPVHISHIKALGTDVWGKSGDVIKLILQARAKGINVTANQYPYTASGTGLSSALLPRWAEVGGREELLKRIDDPATKARLVTEMEANLKRRGGAKSLLITATSDKQLIGKTLEAIAEQWQKSPVEAALEIIKAGRASVASFNMSDADLENFMKQKFVMTGSDGSSGHPRKYGTYPRKLREYVYNKKIISLPFAIQASSGMVAETFSIQERGKIKSGYFADLIVFDEKTIADRATFEQPDQLATGIKYVLVNGQVAVEDGKYTEILAGQALRRKN